jgi:hypothetical protein
VSGRLLITACDAGSANFFAPVLKDLDVPFTVRAQAPASDILDRHGIPCERLDRVGWDGLPEQGEGVVAGDFAAVLSGTSYGPTADKAAALGAKARGLKSAAVVEHWDIYRERFARLEEGRITAPDLYLPDSVWVPDALGVDEAAAAGLPRARLSAVGQPHLEAQTAAFAAGAAVPRGKDVVFVSERVAGDFHRGFTEDEVLEALISVLDLSRHRLVIKLHPAEDESKYDSLAARGVEATVVKRCDLRALLLGAHRVVGMFSMLLLEAALVRRDVISFMPGADPKVFVGNRVGATRSAATVEQLRALLEAPPAANGDGSFGASFAGSRERVTRAIRGLVS